MCIGPGRRRCVYATFKSNFITCDGKYVEAACGIVVFGALSPCLVSVISSPCIACAGERESSSQPPPTPTPPQCRRPRFVFRKITRGPQTCQIRSHRFTAKTALKGPRSQLRASCCRNETDLSGFISFSVSQGAEVTVFHFLLLFTCTAE